jgi:hypothetical protein
MNKKTMLIGLGVLAVAGIGYYMWKKKNETTSGASGSKVGGKKTANPSKATLQAWLATPKGQAAASRMPVNLNSGSGDSGMRYWGQGAWEWIKEQWYADRG